MVKVQPFGNHLRTDKNIRLSLFKIGDDTLVGRACASGIQVHTGNGRFGKQEFDVVLYLFRTETAVAQVRSFASGTDAGQLIGISAIVAGQLVQSFMIGQADITVLTFGNPPARMAFYHRGKPPAVLKQNDLFFPFQCLADILQQQRGKGPVHPLLALQLLDVYRNNLRQLYLLVPLLQLHQPVLSGHGVVPGFYGRRRRAQQSLGAIQRSQHSGGITCMVAGGGVLLLICILVLLVHDNQAQLAEGQEHGRTHSQNDVISAVRKLFLPDFHPFGIRKLRVIDAQTRTEHPLQPFGNLCGQGYFRQQIQHLLPLPDNFFYQMDVNLRLSAGRDSMQQTDILCPETFHNAVVCPLLMLVQRI